jgi:CO/xanthine dehydrogenase Mo-binding subunit
MADNPKLVGQDYITPDLVAKVTGKAKFSEDFRAEGMLFARLLLSPMPHARVTRIDTSAALAMPGVKAILTADDLPAPADSITDTGMVVKANLLNERALTKEPLYQGEPILAVAAVDEITAAEAIEKIQIDFEPLPFNVDPIDALRPGSANPRTQGNVWYQPPPPKPEPGAKPTAPPPPGIKELKWKESDFADAKDGKLPMGETTDGWSIGDIEAGFKSAALVLDETFATSTNHHQTLEPRTVMAYWQNGKVFVHCSTQSLAQTVPAAAGWLGIDPKDVVVIGEYCGGGFGSKITGNISMVIPALLSKKANAPVMMRISREEEHHIGRCRPAMHGRVKVGFDKEGRITALDMFTIADNGPYEQQFDNMAASFIVSLLYQPPAMRWRGVTVLTNTTPTSAQSQPGGLQGVMIMGSILAKAARKLGIDDVAILRINAPEGKAPWGAPFPNGQRGYVTSSFVKQAIDRGVELFKWEERKARGGSRQGTKVRGVGASTSVFFSGSDGFDGLCVIKPDGRLAIQSGIGNLGTESVFDCHRITAELLGIPWDKVDMSWGNTARNLPWTCISGGSQTTHAMSRAAHAAGMDAVAKLKEIAAKALGGRPEDYVVANERVARKGGGGGMSLAQAAQKAIELGGKYDGHEPPADVNNFTKQSAAALAGQGLMGVARDSYKHDGQTFSFVAGFAEVEVDVETGKYTLLDYLAVGDVGTPLHPRSLGGQLLGRSMLGIGHAIGQKSVYDQHYGVPLATRFYQNRPPTILDAPQKMAWDSVNIPDPETPVGAKGIGEPPVGAGANAILNALRNALGDDVFKRGPVNADTILVSLENGRPMQEPLTAHI